jgi:hypothetical protein
MESNDLMDVPENEFRESVVLRLSAQDVAIAENTALTKSVSEDTAFIRAAWAEGNVAVRFFCRLAAAWRFLLKQVSADLPAVGHAGWALVVHPVPSVSRVAG